MQEQKPTRQQKRNNAHKEAKRLAIRAGKNLKGVPRKLRRQVSFKVTKKQLYSGIRKGTEFKSLDEEFEKIGISKNP